MRVTIDLFIGLVTHPRTSYPESVTESGLLAHVMAACPEQGLTCMSAVVDEDLLATGQIAMDRAAIRASIRAEFALEDRWARHLGRRSDGWRRLVLRARESWRQLRLTVIDESAGRRMLRRLANIELAHLSLLRQARDSGARWALIIEDDAGCEDAQALVRAIAALADGGPGFANISTSFTPAQLGIEGLVADDGLWPDGTGQRRILVADRPVTNTVCAVLYRGDFLARLVRELDPIPLEPIVPIDWKLNDALMRMHAARDEMTCWFIEPGPVVQRSMQRHTVGPR